jgi:hypothetical protein
LIAVRDMDALTLEALADELERDVKHYRQDEEGQWLATVLENKARTYRKRARLAKGGWGPKP